MSASPEPSTPRTEGGATAADLEDAARTLSSASAGDLADALSETAMQGVITQLMKGYLVKREDGADFLPASEQITATEASVAASGLMQSAGLEFFELTLWNSWGRV